MNSTMGEVLETPNLAHLSATDYEKVYEPREDSFLFLDALEKDMSFLRGFNPSICLEVGSGSGIISTAVARALGTSCFAIATDLNPDACKYTYDTAAANSTHVDCLQMDLATMLRMDHSIVLLLFNPPYVVTSTEEIIQPSSKSLLHLAWAGGLKGREVTDRLLGKLNGLLSHKSLFYLVIIEENDPEEISQLLSLQGFQGQIIASRKVRNEKLHVMRFFRGI